MSLMIPFGFKYMVRSVVVMPSTGFLSMPHFTGNHRVGNMRTEEAGYQKKEKKDKATIHSLERLAGQQIYIPGVFKRIFLQMEIGSSNG